MSIDKIICVGKNYLDHARELGDTIPEKPVLFLKPASTLRQIPHWGEHMTLDFPDNDPAVQPECEIVLRVAHDGYQMTYEQAKNAISDLTLGLDMTLRTRQSALKKQGHPWTTAKVFKDAAVLGPWIPYLQFNQYMDTAFQFTMNGIPCQRAKGTEMMMKPHDLLVYISHFFPLKTGDIVYTGTPAGVTSILKSATAEIRWDTRWFKVTWK